jgi:pimeloyl-ACP methyl ester carboxylesterase
VVGVLLGPAYSLARETPSINKEVKVNDLTFDVEIIGTGKPVVMVHGFGVDREVMRGCMEPIFEKRPGWKRIYFDLPGMGKTKRAEWIKDSDDILAVVLELTKKVIPGERFLLVGESYGGYLVRGIIYKEPENVLGMAIICPLAVPDDAKRDVPKLRILQRDTSLYGNLSADEKAIFDIMATIQTKRVWDRFDDEMMSGFKKGESEFLERIRRAPNNYAFSFAVDQLPVPFDKPSLIFTGRQDSGVGYNDIWKFLEQYPRASFVVLDMAGHALQIEQETLFNALVNELLDRLEDTKR